MATQVRQKKPIPLAKMPLRPRHWYIFVVSSMEQLIGGALSTIVGIMIPLIVLCGTPSLTPVQEGLLGASSLTGIAVGSVLIGKLLDEMGYLLWFRLCPLLITACALGVYFSSSITLLILFLFIMGIGVGGGYSLDSSYIAELLPAYWRSLFVGLAKATSSLGFIGGAAACFVILKYDPKATVWPYLILIIAALGLVTVLLRIRWYQSPSWLLVKGKTAQAEKAAKEFLGPRAAVIAPTQEQVTQMEKIMQQRTPFIKMFMGKNLEKVLLCGVTWACEGLGVYGFGVFLPILIMALGLQGNAAPGIPRILESVQSTIFINIFIAVGFAVGLLILHRVNPLRLMGNSFLLCALALIILLAGYKLSWPTWISFVCFMVFEAAQNAGPHLVTFIIPPRIYPINERGTGMGIAAMLGKVGAMLGVFFMPPILRWGGIEAVLLVSIAVQFLGAALTFIYGKRLGLL